MTTPTTDTEQEPVENFRTAPEGTEGETPPTEEPDPTEPIGRRRRQRSSPTPEPQTAFGEEVIDVEGVESEFYTKLEIRYANLGAKKEYEAADRDVKAGLVRMGKYDGKPHTIRAGAFLIVIAPGEGETKEISFTREPSIRKTIKRDD